MTPPRYAVGDRIRHLERGTEYRIATAPDKLKVRGEEGPWSPAYRYISLLDGQEYARAQRDIEDETRYVRVAEATPGDSFDEAWDHLIGAGLAAGPLLGARLRPLSCQIVAPARALHLERAWRQAEGFQHWAREKFPHLHVRPAGRWAKVFGLAPEFAQAQDQARRHTRLHLDALTQAVDAFRVGWLRAAQDAEQWARECPEHAPDLLDLAQRLRVAEAAVGSWSPRLASWRQQAG